MIDPQELADVAGILAAMTVVLLMFPGIALFYGGMSGKNNVLNMSAMTMSILGTVTVPYVLFGHSLVLGDSLGDIIGDPTSYFGLVGNEDSGVDGGFSVTADMAFYTMFAYITVAIVASGALGRMEFSAWIVFSMVWVTLAISLSDTGCSATAGWVRSSTSTTTPVVLRCTWPRVSPPWRWRWCWDRGRRPRVARTVCPWSCSVPESCGWAGSGSTAAPPAEIGRAHV